MTAGVFRVGVAFAAGKKSSSLLDGVGDEVLETGKGVIGDHGAHVGCGAQTERTNARGEHGDEGVVVLRGDDDALDADAVLPGGLEGAAHKGVDDAREVGLGSGGEHDGGIFAAELSEDGDQGLGG